MSNVYDADAHSVANGLLSHAEAALAKDKTTVNADAVFQTGKWKSCTIDFGDDEGNRLGVLIHQHPRGRVSISITHGLVETSWQEKIVEIVDSFGS